MAPASPLAQILRRLGVAPRRIRRISARSNIHWAVLGEDGRRLVLRRFGAGPDGLADIDWEADLLRRLAATGLPVAAPLAGPEVIDGAVWALFPRLPGRPLAASNTDDEGYRRLGRTLAAYHERVEALPRPAQRPGWRPLAAQALPPAGGPSRKDLLDRLLPEHRAMADAFAAAAETLEARRLPERLAGLPEIAVHGDFSPWNLLFRGGGLSGILDFELSHLDIAAADVAFARRGSHDALVAGYLERRALGEAELVALDGLWTGAVLQGVWQVLAQDRPDPALLEWNLQQLGKTRPWRPAPARARVEGGKERS